MKSIIFPFLALTLIFVLPISVSAQKKSVVQSKEFYITEFVNSTSIKNRVEKSYSRFLDTYSDEKNFLHLSSDRSKFPDFKINVKKYRQEKVKIIDDVMIKIKKDLMEIFSESEAKYLYELSKHPLFSKMTTYFESKKFEQSLLLPLVTGREYVLGKEKQPNATSSDKK